MIFLNQKGRGLLLLAAVAVGAVLFVGCGDSGADTPGDNSGNNGGNGNPGINTGETVALGGKIWMKKNLNIETADSYCYDNDPSNCAIYGRLYTWEAAKAACPLVGAGWRLPSREDWGNLIVAAGGSSIAGKRLKSTSGWDWNDYDNVSGNGTDDFDFSALPGGYHFISIDYYGGFYDAGEDGLWWMAERGYMLGINKSDGIEEEYISSGHIISSSSVRCIHD